MSTFSAGIQAARAQRVAERNRWRLIGSGEGIHWPDLDEDVSVENLIFGKPSGESQQSLQRWLDQRGRHPPNRPSSLARGPQFRPDSSRIAAGRPFLARPPPTSSPRSPTVDT